MKKPFEVGDRVAYYSVFDRRRISKVDKVLSKHQVEIIYDNGIGSKIRRLVHPRQLARLKPKPEKKEARRVWLFDLNGYVDLGRHGTEEKPEQVPMLCYKPANPYYVQFREVLSNEIITTEEGLKSAFEIARQGNNGWTNFGEFLEALKEQGEK